MSELLENRHEILFLYDVKDANPNGDPIDENKPRIDEETGVNIVTDVRLKRTIRDYLSESKDLEIFVKEVKKEDGIVKTKKNILNDFKIKKSDELIKKCIDVRLFGCTAAIKEDENIILTGPVQFRFGRSLHRVKIEFIKGTSVMAEKENKKQGTFTEMYILPYSLIAFYGLANENAAKYTQMTVEDFELLMEAIWNGTKNLITRSKFGQMPRALIDIEYKLPNFHIGDLDKLISIRSEIEDESFRDVADFELNTSSLVSALQEHKDKIKSIRIKLDNRLQITSDLSPENLKNNIEGVQISHFNF